MRRLISVVGLLFVVALSGCGDDEKPSESATAQQPASTEERSAAPEPTPLKLSASEQRELRERLKRQEGLSSSLVPVAERLETAGYEQRLISGLTAFGQTSVFDGPLTVTIYAYNRQADLAEARSRLTTLESEQPDQTEIAVRGKHIYFGTVTAPDVLDNARFTRIVDIGEGT